MVVLDSVLIGHEGWVLGVSWSPTENCKYIVYLVKHVLKWLLVNNFINFKGDINIAIYIYSFIFQCGITYVFFLSIYIQINGFML